MIRILTDAYREIFLRSSQVPFSVEFHLEEIIEMCTLEMTVRQDCLIFVLTERWFVFFFAILTFRSSRRKILHETSSNWTLIIVIVKKKKKKNWRGYSRFLRSRFYNKISWPLLSKFTQKKNGSRYFSEMTETLCSQSLVEVFDLEWRKKKKNLRKRISD